MTPLKNITRLYNEHANLLTVITGLIELSVMEKDDNIRLQNLMAAEIAIKKANILFTKLIEITEAFIKELKNGDDDLPK